MASDSTVTELTIIQIIKDKRPQTVKHLVALVKETLQIPEDEIIKAVLKLQSEGKVNLSKQPLASPKLAAYLKTEEALWFWVTIAAATATAAAVFTIPEDFYPWVYIRYVLGAIFVLWLPGYTFIKTLFPAHVPIEMPTEALNTIERIALSFVMSIAIVPMVGLLLNYTPWGIRLTPILLSLLALTLVFASTAIIREHKSKQGVPVKMRLESLGKRND